MTPFFRFIWNDTITYLSAAFAGIGVIVAFLPVPDMPTTYGHWVFALGGIGLAYRFAKSVTLLCFGSHTRPEILDKYVGLYDVAKINYSFKTETGTVTGQWQSYDQQHELMVAYWKVYPAFHIAYWKPNEEV